MAPHGTECSFCHDKIASLETASREQTTATLGSACLNHSIDDGIRGVNVRLLGNALLDPLNVVRTLFLLTEPTLDSLQPYFGIYVTGKEF
jgi:hypothetical protein